MKYEIIFKSGKIKNVISKDVNKIKNYITESFDSIKSVKRLDEKKIVGNKGYTAVLLEKEPASDFDFPHEIETFNDIESAKEFAKEKLLGEYHSRKFYVFIYDSIINREKLFYDNPIMVAEPKRGKVEFIDWK